MNKDHPELLDMVAEFQERMGCPAAIPFWRGLINEEATEVKEAFAHLLKELSDYAYVSAGLMLNANMEEAVEQVPVTTDMEFALALVNMVGGTFPTILYDALTRVHQSNMSKLGDDGEPIRHPETGKIMKGPNYKLPDMVGLVDVYLAEGSASVN